jgi:hypothetical protein
MNGNGVIKDTYGDGYKFGFTTALCGTQNKVKLEKLSSITTGYLP